MGQGKSRRNNQTTAYSAGRTIVREGEWKDTEPRATFVKFPSCTFPRTKSEGQLLVVVWREGDLGKIGGVANQKAT